jgi:serine/threonine protein kinase/Tol biopolymer transport system component
MALPPGTRLGAYEIVALAGAGGMGEVYRGRDTRLERWVAIKVLPPSTGAQDIDARQRFEREARAIATLNHPHICTLYDVGRHDEIDYLFMEFVDGETLADRLERGPLPVTDAIRYGIQIADALDRAHRQGVIHRDLKPGNVMVTPAGVKLLDFGLAKLRPTNDAAPALSAVATIDRELTLKGTILGTLQYMSPEQVEGKDTDGRTDVFALGMVLYEMLTGRKAFEGKSHVSLMAAILEREPESMSSIRPVSPALERIVETCLAKDPDDRWQTAREVGRELKRAHEERPTESSAAASSRARVNRLPWIVAAVAASGFLAAVVPAVRHLREPVAESSLHRFTIGIPLTSNPNALAISPDGRRIVYLAVGPDNRPLLWVRALDSLTALPLKGTEGVGPNVPGWSADSRFVLFVANGQLRKMDLLGGLPQAVTDLQLANAYGATANDDGTILLSGNDVLYVVPPSGGPPQQLLDLDEANKEISQRYPHFLPDNDHFLFTAWSDDLSRRAIYAGSITTRERIRLVDGASMAVYSSEGFILYQRDGTLLAQPFDAARLAIAGEPIPVAEDVFYNAGTGRASFSVSRTGALVYSNATSATATRQLVWYDRAGKMIERVGKPDLYEQARLSPDGRRVALARRNPGGDLDIWLMELSSGIASRFTSGGTDETDPVWSPDSQAIAYHALRDRGRTIYVKRVGGNREEPMLQSEEFQVSEDWSNDGRTLVFRVSNVATRVFAVPLTGERTVTKLFESESAKDEFQLSPDGRWIAFNSDESGTVEVYVAAFPSFTDKRQVSDGGSGQPRWRKDGRELFYRTFDGRLMAVPVTIGASLETGAPELLFQTRINSSLGFDAFSARADGQRFLALEPLDAGSTPVINIVLDWTAGLKD